MSSLNFLTNRTIIYIQKITRTGTVERVITEELVNLAQTCFVEVTLIDLIAIATVLTASGGPFCGPNTARCCRLSSLSPPLRHRYSTAFVAKNVLDLATSRSPIMSEEQNQSPSASARVSTVSRRVVSSRGN